MARSILFVTCTVLFVLQASYGAAAKSTLITECGAKSAAIIERSTPACITALKSLKVCTQACANIKAAILDGENPTKCQKATVFSSKFVADASAKKKYIQLCTPKWRPQDIGFATAGSALAPFYYYGAMETLISSKILNPKTAPLGGLSGGAVVSLAVCGEVSPQLMQNASVVAISECVNTWNKTTQLLPCQGQLTSLLVKLVQSVFPKNSTKFQDDCAGRVRIALTKVNASDGTMGSLTPYIETKFETNQIIYDAIAGTSMISCVSTCKPYTLFKGFPVIDGGNSATFKQMCPPNVKRCVTLQEYYPGKYVRPGNGTCYKNGNKPVSAGGKNNCTVAVPDGFNFAPKGNLPTKCPAGNDYFQPPGFSDIYPGMHKKNPLPFTCEEWQNFSYYPQIDAFQTQFDAGKKDAFLWGQNEGLIP